MPEKNTKVVLELFKSALEKKLTEIPPSKILVSSTKIEISRGENNSVRGHGSTTQTSIESDFEPIFKASIKDIETDENFLLLSNGIKMKGNMPHPSPYEALSIILFDAGRLLISGKKMSEILPNFYQQYQNLVENAGLTYGITFAEGIQLATSPLVLDSNYSLRWVENEDMESLVKPYTQNIFSESFDCALEFSSKSEDRSLHYARDKFFQEVRLFSINSASPSVTLTRGIHPRFPRGAMYGHEKNDNHWKIVLDNQKLDEFLKFRSFLDNINFFKELNSTSYSFGLERYNDAILRNVSVAEKLTFAVIGLESFFTDGRDEISYKLSMRCSKLASWIGIEPNQAFRKLKKAYGLRSDYSHGKSYNQNQSKEAAELIEPICNLLRISILLFAVFEKQGTSRDSLLSKIDSTLITPYEDKVTREKLLEQLNGIKLN